MVPHQSNRGDDAEEGFAEPNDAMDVDEAGVNIFFFFCFLHVSVFWCFLGWSSMDFERVAKTEPRRQIGVLFDSLGGR